MPRLNSPTLTHGEQKAILLATAKNPRDHLIYSLALGTGLRLAEIVGLNAGDVYTPDGRPRSRVRLRPEIAKGGRAGDVFLPDALLVKFRKFWRHKASRRERLRPEDPLFCSQSRTRISPRRVQFAFRAWQVKAGFDVQYLFHALRHFAVKNVLQGLARPVPGAAAREARVAAVAIRPVANQNCLTCLMAILAGGHSSDAVSLTLLESVRRSS